MKNLNKVEKLPHEYVLSGDLKEHYSDMVGFKYDSSIIIDIEFIKTNLKAIVVFAKQVFNYKLGERPQLEFLQKSEFLQKIKPLLKGEKIKYLNRYEDGHRLVSNPKQKEISFSTGDINEILRIDPNGLEIL